MGTRRIYGRDFEECKGYWFEVYEAKKEARKLRREGYYVRLYFCVDRWLMWKCHRSGKKETENIIQREEDFERKWWREKLEQ